MCYCNHLTSFGSDLLVAPNPIDFDSVFKNFGSLTENVAVLALILATLGVYIIGVIWARRADKRDAILVGVFNVDTCHAILSYFQTPVVSYFTLLAFNLYHLLIFSFDNPG